MVFFPGSKPVSAALTVVVTALMGVFSVELTTSGTGIAAAALTIITPKNVCVTPGDSFQLTCLSKKGSPLEFLDVRCWREDGSLRTIGDEPNYDVQSSGPRCCNSTQLNRYGNSRRPSCDMEATLTVQHATADDAGSCGCVVTGTDGIPETARIWIQEHTEIHLSEEETVLTLGEEFTVEIQVWCDFGGSFKVFREDSGGRRKQLEHRDGPGPDGEPYFMALGGEHPEIHFPRPTCQHMGNYSIVYTVGRNYRPVETTRILQIRASEGSCPKAVTDSEVPAIPTRESELTSHATTERVHLPSKDPRSGGKPVCDDVSGYNKLVIGILGAGCVLLLLVSSVLGWKYRALKKSVNRQRAEENNETGVPLNDNRV